MRAPMRLLRAAGHVFFDLWWLLAAIPVMLPGMAAAQQISNQLSCQGQLYGYQATLGGLRVFAQTRPDAGFVTFRGTVTAANITGSIAYEGYTAVGPFEGYMWSRLGTVRIAVLDNTGGRMLIYEGGASLGAPRLIGEFGCLWQ